MPRKLNRPEIDSALRELKGAIGEVKAMEKTFAMINISIAKYLKEDGNCEIIVWRLDPDHMGQITLYAAKAQGGRDEALRLIPVLDEESGRPAVELQSGDPGDQRLKSLEVN